MLKIYMKKLFEFLYSCVIISEVMILGGFTYETYQDIKY